MSAGTTHLTLKKNTIFNNGACDHLKPLHCFQSQWSRTQARPPPLGVQVTADPTEGKGEANTPCLLSSALGALPVRHSALAKNSKA